jgi:hypothetical protein
MNVVASIPHPISHKIAQIFSQHPYILHFDLMTLPKGGAREEERAVKLYATNQALCNAAVKDQGL